MKKKSKSPLKGKRKSTDDSLLAERDKTNKELVKSTGITELETDQIVEKGRREADKETLISRSEEDSKGNNKNNNSTSIRDERQRSDDAIEQERFRIDEAMDQERDSKKTSEYFALSKEREQTDLNLLGERAKTDAEFVDATNRLSEEVSEHSKTKTTLTTKEDFMAIVSHDLRNPMSFVSSCAQMLLDKSVSKKMDPEIRNWIELIKENVDLSLRLISDLLDMERIEGGMLNLIIKKCSVSQLITESVKRFSHIALARKISLNTKIPENCGEIYCDHDRIMQVISNLIDNALKFTPAGGEINIKVIANNNEVAVSVHDTGQGISKEKLTHIFDRYTQVNVKDRRGLGLGLYISKMFIEAHQGRLVVESKPGQGSTFTFTLPRC